VKFLDLRHPFFNPLWRRVATVAFCVLWGLFEASSGATFWAVLFLGLGAVTGYTFFVDWHDIPEEGDK